MAVVPKVLGSFTVFPNKKSSITGMSDFSHRPTPPPPLEINFNCIFISKYFGHVNMVTKVNCPAKIL